MAPWVHKGEGAGAERRGGWQQHVPMCAHEYGEGVHESRGVKKGQGAIVTVMQTGKVHTVHTPLYCIDLDKKVHSSCNFIS